jgi:FPC/CPF motif-containing protein YcgG
MARIAVRYAKGKRVNVRQARASAGETNAAHGEEAVRAFKAFLRRKSYPCVGAKSALTRGSLEWLCAGDIRHVSDDQPIAARVQLFASKAHADAVFVSLAVLFPNSPLLSETQFEKVLWQRLRAIHRIDRMQHDWDSSVSKDPASWNFSMSVGGKGFFVIGMHPGASRVARRFQCPVLVFNLHSQFEQLRADGRYDKLRSTIVARDIAFSGSSNPMLATYGQRSEARQYSGRMVSDDWVCPFASPEEEDPE